MRTTVDLPPAAHRRAKELAAARGESLSKVVADLAIRGLAQLDTPVEVSTDPRTGMPLLHVGRRVTDADVAELLDVE